MNKNMLTIRKNFTEMIKRVNLNFKPTIARLNNRSIFSIEGPDANKFLQGLITNDINRIAHNQNTQDFLSKRFGIYTLFLNPKGRIVTDAIITKPLAYQDTKGPGSVVIQPRKDQFFVDIPKQAGQAFTKHLKRYTWKKRVEISQIDLKGQQLSLFAGYGPSRDAQKLDQKAGYLIKQPSSQGSAGNYVECIISDPRNPVFGVRFLAQDGSFDLKKQDYLLISSQQYQNHLLSLGAASFELMFDKLPFQFNTDLFDGISFDKGCYLGQQIVSRGYLTGIIRRRIFPFQTEFSTQNIDKNTVLKDQNGKDIGKVLHCAEGSGLVLVNYLDFIGQQWPLTFSSPIKGKVNSPFHWKLLKYYESMKRNKQILENYIQ